MSDWNPNGVTPAWRLAWARTQVTEAMVEAAWVRSARWKPSRNSEVLREHVRENIAIGIACGAYRLRATAKSRPA